MDFGACGHGRGPGEFCCPCLIGFDVTLIGGSCRDFVPARSVSCLLGSSVQVRYSLIAPAAPGQGPRSPPANATLLWPCAHYRPKPIVLIAPASLKNRWAVERHLNVPRGTPPYDRGSRGVRSCCRLQPASALNANGREYSNSLDLNLARTPRFSKSNFSDAASASRGALATGPPPDHPGASGEVPPRPLLKR